MQVEAGGKANDERETGNKAPGVRCSVETYDLKAE